MPTKHILAFATLFAMPTFAQAEDCKIEDWRWQHSFGNILTVQGATPCASGMITICIYNGGKFIGVANGLIRGYAFQAFASDINGLQNISIKYSVQQMQEI